jgi:hypothetical protein
MFVKIHFKDCDLNYLIFSPKEECKTCTSVKPFLFCDIAYSVITEVNASIGGGTCDPEARPEYLRTPLLHL